MFYKGERMAVTSPNSDLHGYGEAIRKELGKRIPKDERLRVLDVGTGFGITTQFLARWVGKGSAVWTVDPSKQVLAEVRKALGPGARRVRFVEGSADHLGFPDGFFDVVVTVMVLHHVEGLESALREMGRVVRPGGRLIVVDYKPEASHELPFRTRHEEADFFTPERVAGAVGALGMEGKADDYGLWYMVEAARPTRRRARPARARSRAGV